MTVISGRSRVMTRHGIVATSQPLASAAGVQVLQNGGNAVDAAIAANAVMGVVEPNSCGLGGDLFAIVYEAATGRLHGLNASGWTPAGLTPDVLQKAGAEVMPSEGIHTVTVPGVVVGWDALRSRLGTRPMAELIAAAVDCAEEGFPVTDVIAQHWAARAEWLASHEQAASTYLPDRRPPPAGEVFRNQDLAKSLRRIAADGADGFYRGPTAEAILAVSRDFGGMMTCEDLTEFQPEWVEPVSTTYRGWTVYELPPNTQGIAALLMLNLLEPFPLATYGLHSADALHVMIEAKKLAYADMLHYVGDPRFSNGAWPELLDKAAACVRARSIDMNAAAASVLPSLLPGLTTSVGADTIYMCAIDAAGNIVSLIQSIYEGFGSGIVPPGCGFALHNRGALFTLEKGHPNVLAPRKRPLHTIIPAFMQKDDVRVGFGIMGGFNQAQAHAQFVANVVDFGLDIQQALEAGRFTKPTFMGTDVFVEAHVPETIRYALMARGHDVTTVPPRTGTFGYGQAVMSDGAGVHYGASDPRHDGAAVPQGPPLPARP
jgi:gamma-glutamyltranspeptidase/glutathione hydrolase